MDARAVRNYPILLAPTVDPQRGATSELPVDAELRGALATRRYWLQHIIREFEGPTHEAERIIRLIDASQRTNR
jgi:hypothetical protein